MLVALFAVFMMACTIAVVVGLVGAIDWPWVDAEVPVRRSVLVFFGLLALHDSLPPTLGALCWLVAIGFGLRRPVRLLFKLDERRSA